jgi:predicted SAM-dependent methyltransferase
MATMPRLCSIGLCARGIVARHVCEHVVFRAACVALRHGKGVEQTLHVFQNGYTRFALPCRFFCVLEYVASAAFNETAMVSGDELVCVI